MFDAYYSNTTESYHIAMTFTKFGLMEGELGGYHITIILL
jgi:hypothetical protein